MLYRVFCLLYYTKVLMSMFFQLTVSYIYSNRRLHLSRWRQDVHHRRTRYCVRRRGECDLWGYILDNHVVLSVGNAFVHSENG